VAVQPRKLPMQKHKILWADDDYDDLQMIQEILSKKKGDFEIIEVHNGKEALEYLRRTQKKSEFPCLIILDINMPILDGKETLSILKSDEQYREIPVVVFSTSESELDKLYCQKFNTEMVTKPPTFSSLNTALDKLLKECK
jgi:CheY-like chemotaxis protein